MYEMHAGHDLRDVGHKRVPNEIKVEMDRKSTKSFLILRDTFILKNRIL